MQNDLPEWCPQWAWDEAYRLASQVVAERGARMEAFQPIVARALVAAERRGKMWIHDISLDLLNETFEIDFSCPYGLAYRERPIWQFTSARDQRGFNAKWARKPAGSPSRSGHGKVYIFGRSILIHRIIYAIHHRIEWHAIPALIDHINGDPSDNRPDNLRPATKTENCRNARVRKDSKSGLKGIRIRENGKFSAKIKADGKDVWLGTFSTIEDAQRAYADAAVRFHGEFAPEHIRAAAIRQIGGEG
ncbi:HNH endonuclease [Devosia honganensis]|uniref:HNH endonuclease n=1 Tax=Devosia honganensis TaxID=1610527 RepID=A0ABV7X8D7_9HYPH